MDHDLFSRLQHRKKRGGKVKLCVGKSGGGTGGGEYQRTKRWLLCTNIFPLPVFNLVLCKHTNIFETPCVFLPAAKPTGHRTVRVVVVVVGLI